jgi:hypothetical protein
VTSDPTDITASGLAMAYRDGRLTPVGAVDALLARIARLEPLLRDTSSCSACSGLNCGGSAVVASDHWPPLCGSFGSADRLSILKRR